MKKSNVILIWGAGTGIALALYTQILHITGTDNSGLRFFNFLILFLGLFIGTLQFRNKANGGYLTFGKGFQVGFYMCLISVFIGVMTLFVDLNIHPDMINKIWEAKQTDMINGGATPEEIEMRMKYVKMFTTPFWLTMGTIIFNVLFGVIFSLLCAGLLSRKKLNFEDTEPTNQTIE